MGMEWAFCRDKKRLAASHPLPCLSQERCPDTHKRLMQLAPSYFAVHDHTASIQAVPGCAFAAALDCMLFKLMDKRPRPHETGQPSKQQGPREARVPGDAASSTATTTNSAAKAERNRGFSQQHTPGKAKHKGKRKRVEQGLEVSGQSSGKKRRKKVTGAEQ